MVDHDRRVGRLAHPPRRERWDTRLLRSQGADGIDFRKGVADLGLEILGATRDVELDAVDIVSPGLIGVLGEVLVGYRLQKRQEHHGVRGKFGVDILRIFHKADDLIVAAVANTVEAQMFSEGIFVGEKFAGKRVIDYSNVVRGWRIPLLDRTTAQETRANGLEIARLPRVLKRSQRVSDMLMG